MMALWTRSRHQVIARTLSVACTIGCATTLLALQSAGPDFAGELEAGKQAAARGEYPDAVKHFRQANLIRQEKCSECYVWLARMGISAGALKDALEDAEKAVATAASNTERSRAQLYRGVILGREGNLAGAEAAFKASSVADSSCVECKFNLGFVLLKESKDAEGVMVLKTVAPKFAGTPRGREIQRFIDDPSRIRKNYAPEFSARTLSGEEINLDALKGKVVLFDFWGTWCAPCRVSLPLLKELAAKVDPAKVAIVSVDEGDSKESWERFVKTNGMTWLQVYDGDLSLYQAFHVDGYPRYYVLSKDGFIVAEFKGWAQTGEATISNAIAEALKQ
jgi:thiol-disulfide isomerase/thioredoxin